MRRLIALTGLSVLALGGLVAAGGGTASAAASAPPLPSNCSRPDGDDLNRVVCLWTSGTGNRFTVPAGVESVAVTAVGAHGGNVGNQYDDTARTPGGRGGVGYGNLDFRGNGPGGFGRTVVIDVGTPGGDGSTGAGLQGVAGAGGAPGGGGGPTVYGLPYEGFGGGGGYSAVRLTGTPSNGDSRVVVGGGGGGAAGGFSGRQGIGGDAGVSANRRAGGGGAGTTTAGGAGGTTGDPSDSGRPGKLRQGGGRTAACPGAGGGGGGVYGGGSGACFTGAGGGGSSTGGSLAVSSGPAIVSLSFQYPLA